MAKAGRPTDLDEDVVNQVWEYLETYRKHGDIVPTIEGLACFIKCSVSAIYQWESRESENGSQFKEAVNAVRASQGKELLNGGLDGSLNSGITKLILTKHGYSDKTQQEVSGPNGGPVQSETTWVIQPVKPRGGE